MTITGHVPLQCAGLPVTARQKLEEVADLWLNAPTRPQVLQSVLEHWDDVVHEWVENEEVPLLIRKKEPGRVHGEPFPHEPTGRMLVSVDNSPATWCFAAALRGEVWSCKELLLKLEVNEIPVDFLTAKDPAKYKGTLSKLKAYNLNDLGWKVSHIIGVKLGTRGTITRNRLIELKRHTYNLLRPKNMFLVPKDGYDGLGEVKEVVAAFRRAQNVRDYVP